MINKVIAFTRDGTLDSEIDKWIAREVDIITGIIAVSSTTIVGKMIITYKVRVRKR